MLDILMTHDSMVDNLYQMIDAQPQDPPPTPPDLIGEQKSNHAVADSSAQAWQEYCDARLRQFNVWR